ncbi:hypothetical protein X975_03454, partial [Stegodyphus mimosarum]
MLFGIDVMHRYNAMSDSKSRIDYSMGIDARLRLRGQTAWVGCHMGRTDTGQPRPQRAIDTTKTNF